MRHLCSKNAEIQQSFDTEGGVRHFKADSRVSQDQKVVSGISFITVWAGTRVQKEGKHKPASHVSQVGKSCLMSHCAFKTPCVKVLHANTVSWDANKVLIAVKLMTAWDVWRNEKLVVLQLWSLQLLHVTQMLTWISAAVQSRAALSLCCSWDRRLEQWPDCSDPCCMQPWL